MTTEKPQRIEDDPEGYDPVFDGDEYGCPFCDIRGTKNCDSDGVCLSISRPEGRGVHYVKKESGKMTTEQTLATVKRQRVDHKKEWYIDQWSIERVRAHAAECRAINAESRVKELESQSLFKRIFRRSK